MLPYRLLRTLEPVVMNLTPAQRLELIRWIAEAPSETEAETEAASSTWDARISEESAAWYARPEADRKPYAGQYVAVLEGQVIDHDADRGDLYQRVRQRYPDTPVLITTAEARGPREFRILSPRLERLSDG